MGGVNPALSLIGRSVGQILLLQNLGLLVILFYHIQKTIVKLIGLTPPLCLRC